MTHHMKTTVEKFKKLSEMAMMVLIGISDLNKALERISISSKIRINLNR